MRGERFNFASQDVDKIAILIMRTADGTHTGILHRKNGTLFRLGLAWHERLESTPASGRDPCVIPELEPEEINDITGMCRLIETLWSESGHAGIPYSFRCDPTTHFSDTGDLILGEGLGLTCSTFVIKVFEKAKEGDGNNFPISRWLGNSA